MLERKFEAKAREELEALKRDAALAAAAFVAAISAPSDRRGRTEDECFLLRINATNPPRQLCKRSARPNRAEQAERMM